MTDIPQQLKFTTTHEWIELDEQGNVRVGITDTAQHLLGDLVYVELPEVGQVVTREEECGVVESVKAASDVYAPLSGEVIAVNEALNDAPELVNQQPYADGWIFQLALSDLEELDGLLNASTYQQHISANEE